MWPCVQDLFWTHCVSSFGSNVIANYELFFDMADSCVGDFLKSDAARGFDAQGICNLVVFCALDFRAYGNSTGCVLSNAYTQRSKGRT
jgi:hypothetical protein